MREIEQILNKLDLFYPPEQPGCHRQKFELYKIEREPGSAHCENTIAKVYILDYMEQLTDQEQQTILHNIDLFEGK